MPEVITHAGMDLVICACFHACYHLLARVRGGSPLAGPARARSRFMAHPITEII
jgi:hypothetical protein